MPKPIYSGDQKYASIALTFDDGPYDITSKLLDVLRKHNVKATFFCVAPRVKELPQIVKQTYNEGHTIANHSDENQSLRTLDDNTVLKNLRNTNEVIKQVTGYTPQYFRPPLGEPPNWDTDKGNAPDRPQRVTNLAATLGLTHIHWSIDTNDWRSPGVESIVTTLLYAKKGSIILCHDLPGEENQPKGEHTIKALDIAIPQLKQRGLSFVTIEELLSTTGKCPPDSQVYVVQPDDYLSKIAEKFYGDGSEQSWRRIYEANKDLISDPTQIEVGWKLCIPQ